MFNAMLWSKIKKSISIASSNEFSTASERDSYFVSNPSDLVEGMYITLGSNIQKRQGGSWVDVTPFVKGDKGSAFTYSDFTPEQLAGLKGEKGDTGDTGKDGEKGDPFVYSDFTPEQLAGLKGEKGDTGAAGKDGINGKDGANGVNGTNGKDGINGKDGVNATINGRESIEISQGANVIITETPDGIEISATGGGSGGTSDYRALENKPSINGVELSGDKTSADLKIESTYTNTDPSVIEVGGIKINTTFENKTMSEMFDMMLYPELFPSFTTPKLTTTLNVTTLEVGTTTNAKITSTFNRGTINPAYGTSGYRSGAPISYVYDGETTDGSSLSFIKDIEITSNTEKTITYSVRCNYSAGEQPLSSKGNAYSTPLTAGHVDASDNVNIVFPYYATTNNITTLTKQALSKIGSYIQLVLVGEDDVNKQGISYASIHGDVSRISVLNTLNNQWEDAELSSFTKTNEERNINGITQTYNKYAFNGSKIGSRTIRFYV